MAQTLPGALDWWARMRPDAAAVVLAGDRLSYARYKAWSDRVAAMLEADGLEPGDRVAIVSHNSLAYCALIMGVIRAGGIVSPVNFRYTPREIREIERHHRLAVVIEDKLTLFIDLLLLSCLGVHKLQ